MCSCCYLLLNSMSFRVEPSRLMGLLTPSPFSSIAVTPFILWPVWNSALRKCAWRYVSLFDSIKISLFRIYLTSMDISHGLATINPECQFYLLLDSTTALHLPESKPFGEMDKMKFISSIRHGDVK